MEKMATLKVEPTSSKRGVQLQHHGALSGTADKKRMPQCKTTSKFFLFFQTIKF
jgi:hypothetical protein